MLSLMDVGPVHPRALLSPTHGGSAASSLRIPVDELLTARFIVRNTKYSNFAALLEASGFSSERFSYLEQRADQRWDEFIRCASGFSDWSQMLRDARGEWMMRRLGIFVDA